MKDELERFIKSHRKEFDQVESPDLEAIWQDINRKVHQHSRVFSILKIAASITLIAMAAYWLGYHQQQKEMIVAVEDYYPEWTEVKAHYSSIIKRKMEEIEKVSVDTKQFQYLYDELDFIEQEYDSQIQDLNEYGTDEELIRLLITYHERKLRVLETILREFEKLKYNEQLENQHPLL